jgi:hypothetical protein
VNTQRVALAFVAFVAMYSVAYSQGLEPEVCRGCAPGDVRREQPPPTAPSAEDRRAKPQGTYHAFEPVARDRAVRRSTMAERGGFVGTEPGFTGQPANRCSIGSGCYGATNPERLGLDAIVPTPWGGYQSIPGSGAAYRAAKAWANYNQHVMSSPYPYAGNYPYGASPYGYGAGYGSRMILLDPTWAERAWRRFDNEETIAGFMLVGSDRFLRNVTVYVDGCAVAAGDRINSPRTSDVPVPLEANRVSQVTFVHENFKGYIAGFTLPMRPESMAMYETVGDGGRKFFQIPVNESMFMTAGGYIREFDKSQLVCK